MSHPKARLTVHGRLLLVGRVTVEGWAVAHAAKAMGICRQCAHRWINRYRAQGQAGLVDRSSAPHRHSNQTSEQFERRVLTLRRAERRGPDWSAHQTGVPARTVTRILRCRHAPYLRGLDPLAGVVIRASKTTAVRYEHDHPGSLVDTDVKKIGRVPDGGGWPVHGRANTSLTKNKRGRIGYDYVHWLVDDHSRYAYTEVPPDGPHHGSLPRPRPGCLRGCRGPGRAVDE